jgi:hypothetical protein
MSRSGKIAYALSFSSVFATIWYVIGSYMLQWEHFQVLILIGFGALASVSGAIFWFRHRSNFVLTRKLSMGTGLTTVGMVWTATGLAWLERMPGTAAWILTLAIGPILAIVGLTIAIMPDSNENTVNTGGDINSERQ